MIRDAVADVVPILGALPRVADLVMRERHLGLHLPHEARQDYVDQLTALIEQHVDLDRLLEVSLTRRPPQPPRRAVSSPTVRVGVARDEAFCLYYADNLELLEQAGAELVEFSPINDPLPDNLDSIYIGRGYPELHAAKLTDNTATREAIREFAIARGPVYAECGGLIYLSNNLKREEATYPLCGILPFNTKMPARLTLAYVEVRTTGGLFGPDQITRGHLYHHSEISGEPPAARYFHLRTSRGDQTDEGYYLGNVLASYAHLHFASEPTLATAFLERCRRFRASAN